MALHPRTKVLDKRVTQNGVVVARVLPVSSNPAVVQIENDALDTCTARAMAPGTATISKTYGATTISAAYTVFAKPIHTTSSVGLTDDVLEVGETTTAYQFWFDQYGDAMAAPAGTWVSTNTSLATVHPVSGLVTALAGGDLEIRLDLGGGYTIGRALRVNQPASGLDMRFSAAPVTYALQGLNPTASMAFPTDALTLSVTPE